MNERCDVFRCQLAVTGAKFKGGVEEAQGLHSFNWLVNVWLGNTFCALLDFFDGTFSSTIQQPIFIKRIYLRYCSKYPGYRFTVPDVKDYST